MTALRQYQRLESTGLWRGDPEDQRREVVVQLGEATLVLTDPRTEVALSHWSLPAIGRINPGEVPALFAPHPDARETLEMTDPQMIAALEAVNRALVSARARPGRLRGWLVGGTTLTLLAIGVFWLPDALIAQTAELLPPAKRAEIGEMALDSLTVLTGAPCTRGPGLEALARLSDRLFGPAGTPILFVTRDGVPLATHLPGDLILASNGLISSATGPEALAGAILAEAERAATLDPMLTVLRHAGLVPTFRLLTSGNLPAETLAGYGQALLATTPPEVDETRLLSRLAAAGVPVAPYAAMALPEGAPQSALIAKDALAGTSPEPLMSDGDWLELQAICDD